MSKRKYGDQRACRTCGTDVEWHGRDIGWIDRGGNRSCAVYETKEGFVYPKTKHAVSGSD